MQVFRLMGMPDKLIAFDELPESLLNGIEMIPADTFPRHWKNWLGKKKVTVKIPPERDIVTGVVKKYPEIETEDFYFYLIDWTVNPVVEKWRDIEDYVKRTVSPDIRLKDRLEDMAIPLASDKISQIQIEPEDVPVIPVPKVMVDADGNPVGEKAETSEEIIEYGCDYCDKTFKKRQGINLHVMKVHPGKVIENKEADKVEEKVEELT